MENRFVDLEIFGFIVHSFSFHLYVVYWGKSGPKSRGWGEGWEWREPLEFTNRFIKVWYKKDDSTGLFVFIVWSVFNEIPLLLRRELCVRKKDVLFTFFSLKSMFWIQKVQGPWDRHCEDWVVQLYFLLGTIRCTCPDVGVFTTIPTFQGENTDISKIQPRIV